MTSVNFLCFYHMNSSLAQHHRTNSMAQKRKGQIRFFSLILFLKRVKNKKKARIGVPQRTLKQ